MSNDSAHGVALALLGPFSVELPGDPSALTGRMAELFAVMAIAGKAMSRLQMIQALYDGESPDSADNAVRTYISVINRQSAPFRPIIRSGLLYSIDPSAVRVDVAQFEMHCEMGRGFLDAEKFEAAERSLLDALALVRGDSFQGLRDLRAFSNVRTGLAKRCLDAQEDLADARLALGKHESAVTDLLIAAEREPSRERRWRQLMLALYRSGRQREAAEAFERARTILTSQAGLDPCRDLRDLLHKILNQSPTLDWATQRTDEHRTLPFVLSDSNEGFFGRESELEVLDHGGRVSVVIAAGGIGKSTLVGEFGRRVHASGSGTVLFGCCDALDNEPLSALRRSFPVSKLSTRSSSDDVVSTYLALSAAGPVTLILDDAHLADDVSVAVVRGLARLQLPHVCRVVVAGRSCPWLEEIVDWPGVNSLRLRSLDRVAIETWIDSSLAGHQVSDSNETRRTLVDVGIRSPLLLKVAMSTALAGNGLGLEFRPQPLDDSQKFDSVLLTAVDRLFRSFSTEAITIIRTAAAMDVDIDEAALAKVVSVPIDVVLRSIDAAVEVGLIITSTGTRFVHPIVAAAILEAAPRAERLAIRLALATADALPEWERAKHGLLAIPLISKAEALVLSRQGRAVAIEAGEFGALLMLTETEVEVRQAQIADRSEEVFQLYFDMLIACERKGFPERADALRERILRMAELDLNVQWAAKVVTRGPADGRTIGPGGQLSRVVRALHLCDPQRESQRITHLAAKLLAEKVMLSTLTGAAPKLIDLDELRDYAEVGDFPETRTLALRSIIVSQLGSDDVGRRVEQSRQLLALTRETDDVALRSEAISLVLRSHVETGDVEAARAAIAEFGSFAFQSRRPVDLWTYYISRSTVESMIGNLSSAAALAGEAAALADEFAVHDAETVWWVQRSVLRLLSNIELADHTPPSRRERSSFPSNVGSFVDLSGLRACIALALRCLDQCLDIDLVAARQSYAESVAYFTENSHDFLHTMCAALLAECAWRLREVPPKGLLAEFRSGEMDSLVVVGLNPSACLGPVLRYVAILQASSGDERASMTFERALRFCADRRLLSWEVIVAADFARYLHDREDPNAVTMSARADGFAANSPKGPWQDCLRAKSSTDLAKYVSNRASWLVSGPKGPPPNKWEDCDES